MMQVGVAMLDGPGVSICVIISDQRTPKKQSIRAWENYYE